jgi:hypothetical protein
MKLLFDQNLSCKLCRLLGSLLTHDFGQRRCCATGACKHAEARWKNSLTRATQR